MRSPTPDDKFVKVRAYLTDETFGYDHWRAAQFSAPGDARPAVLIICETEAEQAAWLHAFAASRPDPPVKGAPGMTKRYYLGDAVYVDHDERGLVLTTENGIEATNTIVLEPEVWAALVQYVRPLEGTETVEEERDRYLTKLNLLEAAVEKMVPLKKVEELERILAEPSRLDVERFLLKRVEMLMDSTTGTPEGEELRRLADLLHDFYEGDLLP